MYRANLLRVIILLCAGSAGLLLSGCGQMPPGAPATAATPPPTVEVPTTAVGEPVATVAGGDSGVYGVVQQGPACPGPASAETPCPDAPIAANVSVRDATTDQEIVQFTAAADGTFRQALPPGRYWLEAGSPDGTNSLSPKPVEVTVTAGTYVEVTIPVDTGLRGPGSP